MPPYTRSRRSTTLPVPDAAAGIIPSPLYNDEEEDVLMHTPEEEDVEEGWIMVPADLDDEILEYLMRSPTYYETDYEDEEEEEFVLPSPGVGGLISRIPMDHIDYNDMYYDEGLPGYVVDEFLRTASCAEAAADGGGEELCVVCQDDLCQEDDRKVGILECGHRFHADCIGEWLQVKNVCPLCKAFGIGCFT